MAEPRGHRGGTDPLLKKQIQMSLMMSEISDLNGAPAVAGFGAVLYTKFSTRIEVLFVKVTVF
jgi:hypothetical protein